MVVHSYDDYQFKHVKLKMSNVGNMINVVRKIRGFKKNPTQIFTLARSLFCNIGGTSPLPLFYFSLHEFKSMQESKSI